MLTSGTLMNPKHPVYIISKGRWDGRHTSKALEKMSMPYSIVVEDHEYEQYARVINEDKILILPEKYIRNYDACTTDQGKSNGPGAARNFCWENSLEKGATSHWVMDDNIAAFGRINRNLYIHVTSGTIFKAAEDFIELKGKSETLVIRKLLSELVNLLSSSDGNIMIPGINTKVDEFLKI